MSFSLNDLRPAYGGASTLTTNFFLAKAYRAFSWSSLSLAYYLADSCCLNFRSLSRFFYSKVASYYIISKVFIFLRVSACKSSFFWWFNDSWCKCCLRISAAVGNVNYLPSPFLSYSSSSSSYSLIIWRRSSSLASTCSRSAWSSKSIWAWNLFLRPRLLVYLRWRNSSMSPSYDDWITASY